MARSSEFVARESVARGAARDLLQEAGVESLPVDPFAIASALRPPIGVVERRLEEDVYGACCLVSNRFVILVSPSCPSSGHKRFTVAHELGHYRIDGHVEAMFSGGDQEVWSKGAHFQQGATWVEREADYFASELLMPEHLVRPLLRGCNSMEVVRRIEDACGVSLTAAAITMVRLTRDPLAALVSKDGVLEWPAVSESLRTYPWARMRQKGEWAPPRSATRRLGRDPSSVLEGAEDSEEGLLCEWFPEAPDETLVTEEAVGLGAYGRVLTLLVPDSLPDEDEEQERAWRSRRSDVDEEV